MVTSGSREERSARLCQEDEESKRFQVPGDHFRRLLAEAGQPFEAQPLHEERGPPGRPGQHVEHAADPEADRDLQRPDDELPPRIGLPAGMKWLSPEMIHAMDVAISEAAKRNMYVILYDEGMYPSGSSSGQVVARNPAHAARGLAKIDLKTGEVPKLPDGAKLVTILERPQDTRIAVIEQPSGGVIRGLHYLNEGEQRLREDSPPAGDILNPEAVTSFIKLVYDRFAKEFGKYFGNTVFSQFWRNDPQRSLSHGRRG